MKKLSLALLFIAAIVTACGSDGNVNSDSTPGDDAGLTPPDNNGDGNNGNGNGKDSGTHDVTPLPDAGAPIDQDTGTGDTTDSGAGGQDSGSGGDQDGGVTGTGDSGTGGGGDQDSGSGGGTADSGTGGGGDQDSGSGGGTTDGGTGGQDSGSGGGDKDSGHTCGGDDSCTPHSCVLSQGYFKNHAGSVIGLTLGGVSYTQSEVLALLGTSSTGDASLILARQLIAALLNGGACDCNASTTVQAAQDWLVANKDADGRLPYGVASSCGAGATGTALGATLDTYNNGGSGTPHCE